MSYKFEKVKALMEKTKNFDMEIALNDKYYLIIKDVEKCFYSINFKTPKNKRYIPIVFDKFDEIFTSTDFEGYTLEDAWVNVEVLSFNNSDINYFV